MKSVRLTLSDFPGDLNGSEPIRFTEKGLIRAVVAAGDNPKRKVTAPDELAHLEGLAATIRSSLDMSGDLLRPTGHFRKLGSTIMGQKSFAIGNALCAHTALKKLGIPWLVDVESLPAWIKLKRKAGATKRPDFLGRDTNGNWYVFESKGYTSKPGPADFEQWKEQTKAIRKINGASPERRIVSASYLNSNGVWEVQWMDPPDGNGEDLNISDAEFFDAYYQHVLRALRTKDARFKVTPEGRMVHLPSAGVWMGLQENILIALNQGAHSMIQFYSLGNQEDERSGVAIFPDGLLVQLDDNEAPAKQSLPIDTLPIDPTHNQFGDLPTNTMNIHTERHTQNRVVKLFRDELGYRYLGDWSDRYNSNLDEALATAHLAKAGYSSEHISRALFQVRKEADNPARSLYENNKAVYELLRYGVPVKIEAGKVTETVRLIDWEYPENNDFAVAEEVTLKGGLERRPDLVIYLNGIAIGVMELKNASTDIGTAMRQLLSNQQKEFNQGFFSTVQIVFAGNDSEGLRYGTIGTAEKYFLTWKEDEEENTGFKLDKYLRKMCRKDHLLELLHDFVLFDGGVKKLPRVHQYFGVKAAQKHVNAYRGGIIWHTQGSGKSIVMVLLAKWILENKPKARVLIVTDRDELDKQIARVLHEAGVVGNPDACRATSGHDLMAKLGQANPRLLCTLVHKFGKKGLKGAEFDAFLEELRAQPPLAVGEIFIFVDECHRTQSGKLHKTMAALLPGAVFIGFTGTPLLKQDKATSREVFGDYIHTYKFGEAVADRVVLDLVYESRDIEQQLGSQDKIDAWFDAKTKGLNEWQRQALREQWGTMQKVLSSRSRMERLVEDVVFDFGVKPRLSSERGNAILVASSIYEAVKYYELFQKTVFKGRCAVVTSYNPQAGDVTLEETGQNTETEKQFVYTAYTKLLSDVSAAPGKSPTETYEDAMKKLFIKQPAQMRLLIVVDKLLTGFDAPSCTYLYIDKSMQDHGLFQAICRTNRLDGEDKPFGYIVDYKDLFKNLINEKGTGALQVYTSELDDEDGGASPEVLMQDRLKKGRERLEAAMEALALLCEPVEPPKGELEYIHYFCGNTEKPDDLQEHEPQRVALYKGTATLLRAYANIADDLSLAGFTPSQIPRIKEKVERHVKLRDIIRKASGETLDLKAYEADMRHLIDTYIEAREPRRTSQFDEIGLLEVIVNSGMAEAIAAMPEGIKSNPTAVAETIANNVRSKIVQEQLNNPAFYEKMSELLREIIADLRAKRISYEQFLKRMAELAKQVHTGTDAKAPPKLDTPGKRALYDNLLPTTGAKEDTRVKEDSAEYASAEAAWQALELALRIDTVVKQVRPAGWRGLKARENVIKEGLMPLLNHDEAEVERIFAILRNQKEY